MDISIFFATLYVLDNTCFNSADLVISIFYIEGRMVEDLPLEIFAILSMVDMLQPP